ncbi:MAG: rRNA maturation RNase YbeY [Deltaproteobacteria bacterium]|nr:rRNA maturation RNase YbeY [Deltaproteobacteria bacterium]
MPVEIYCRKDNPTDREWLMEALSALLSYSKKKRALLEVQLVGRNKMRFLNHCYRGKDRVTDVLSFPMDVTAPFKNAPWHLGEIVIATSVAQQQAKQARRSLDFQVLRLSVHGFVHLEGMDHEKSSQERELFEKREKKYLSFLDKKGWISWDGSLLL